MWIFHLFFYYVHFGSGAPKILLDATSHVTLQNLCKMDLGYIIYQGHSIINAILLPIPQACFPSLLRFLPPSLPHPSRPLPRGRRRPFRFGIVAEPDWDGVRDDDHFGCWIGGAAAASSRRPASIYPERHKILCQGCVIILVSRNLGHNHFGRRCTYFCSNAVRTYDDDDLRALIVAAALIKWDRDWRRKKLGVVRWELRWYFDVLFLVLTALWNVQINIAGNWKCYSKLKSVHIR